MWKKAAVSKTCLADLMVSNGSSKSAPVEYTAPQISQVLVNCLYHNNYALGVTFPTLWSQISGVTICFASTLLFCNLVIELQITKDQVEAEKLGMVFSDSGKTKTRRPGAADYLGTMDLIE